MFSKPSSPSLIILLTSGWRIEWFAFPKTTLYLHFLFHAFLCSGQVATSLHAVCEHRLSFLMHLQLVSSCPNGELISCLSLACPWLRGFSSALILRSLLIWIHDGHCGSLSLVPPPPCSAGALTLTAHWVLSTS